MRDHESGKTHTLVEITKALNPKTGRYLAYNKAIATESQDKFPGNIKCSTVHSMAYRETVIKYGLKVGFFRAKNIKDRISYPRKVMVYDALEKFFLSRDVKMDIFLEREYPNMPTSDRNIAKGIFGDMKSSKIACTHGFYLKLYHLLLANELIEPDEVDILMIDEFGDVNGVILEVFRLLPAKKKVAAGDIQQNIYSFNSTINGFEAMKDEGKLMTLTQSFRVGSSIAKKIQSFSNEYLDADMKFSGMKYLREPEKHTIAYIARTNSTIIGKMIELDEMNVPYNITRSAKALFELPLIIINLKPGETIYNPEFKYLEDDVDDYYGSTALQMKHSSLLGYIASEHSDHIGIKAAITLIAKYGRSTIVDTYYKAKDHEVGETRHQITLTTAHSSKGLEWDTVYIMPDMNLVLAKILENFEEHSSDDQTFLEHGSDKFKEEFRLFYVCISRCKYKLFGADMLL